MQLEKVGRYNDFSEKLRGELEEKVNALGKTAQFKFFISNRDPHPDNRGRFIYPSIWTLDPKVFPITDPYETDKAKSKVKQVGLVTGLNDKGEPDRFGCIRVIEKNQGLLELDLTDPDDRYKCMYALLHPKLKDGKFADSKKTPVFELIDVRAVSVQKRAERSERKKALDLAEAMSDKEVELFADAMQWDSTEDIEILRAKVEELAETTPAMFNQLNQGKTLEYRAAVKRGLDKRVIAFDPSEWKFLWVADGTPAAVLQMQSGKSEVEALAEWLQAGGEQASKVYKRLKELLK